MGMMPDDRAMDVAVDPSVVPIGERVAQLSTEFGDDGPQASQTRVVNMQRTFGLSDDALRALLDEAATIVRSQATTITKRGRDGAVIHMPYLLATLRSLVEATDHHAVTAVTAPPVSSMSVMPPPVGPTVPDRDDLPATSEAEIVWQAVRGEVRQDMTVENYVAWFVPTRAIALEGEVLRVMAPTPFHQQWLEHKLRGCVERALRRVGYGGVRVVYDSAMLDDAASTVDQAVTQAMTQDVPMPAPIASPCATPPTSASSSGTLTAASTPHPTRASMAVPPLVVACPSCRSAPCRCQLGDQLRRVIAARAAPVRAGCVGSPGP